MNDMGEILDHFGCTFANHARPPAGRWQLAFDLLKVMASQKERPNVRTFNAAIAACAEASEWQRALLLQQDQRWVRAY